MKLASARLRNPMICSSVDLLFLVFTILLVGGLMLLQVRTAGAEEVTSPGALMP
jgi:hypothetical protein